MAEILVRAVDNTVSAHPRRWRIGMPVLVLEDGALWGTKDVMPLAAGGRHYLLKIPGVTVAQINNLLMAKWGITLDDPDFDPADPDPDKLPVRKKAVDFVVADLPPNLRNQLQRDLVVTLTTTEVRKIIRHIRLNERETP